MSSQVVPVVAAAVVVAFGLIGPTYDAELVEAAPIVVDRVSKRCCCSLVAVVDLAGNRTDPYNDSSLDGTADIDLRIDYFGLIVFDYFHVRIMGDCLAVVAAQRGN